EKGLTVSTIVAEHYARGGPVDSVGTLVTKLADGDPAVAEAVVRGLVNGWPSKKQPKLGGSVEKDLARLAARLSKAKRGLLVQLAASWGSKSFEKHAAEIAGAILAQVKDGALKVEERVAAARELVKYQPADKKTVQTLLDLITPQTPPELASGFLGALQQS